MAGRPAAGGGRWVSVAPERLERWLRGFAERHGTAEAVIAGDVVRLRAADGALAELQVPFPPLSGPSAGTASPADRAPLGAPSRDRDPLGASSAEEAPSFDRDPQGEPSGDRDPRGAFFGDRDARGARSGDRDSGASADLRGEGLLPALVAHAAADRVVGVLLVRLGGHAAGVFEGRRLVVSKVGSRLVHGRSAAGGWSQHRFARRREKQAGEASRAAAEVAARVLLPRADALEAVVLGGDRRAVDALRADRRLAPLFALEAAPFLDVPDPRLAVLQDTPDDFRAVRIRLLDPAG
ncbi:acVLRF1 family peptidyl-tRNA hydrolase [Sphaerisporangium dianthi]|uniref:AcVLRF1 family peptidyl-tRNA hydrolase n=1 Tax=Sphaerisporangium dianthi TaxID=1436120 RepID=A0ABV9CHQ7_9ACTN